MTLTKRKWIVLGGIVSVLLAFGGLVVHYVSIDRKYNYGAEFFKKMPCPWIFSDSAKSGIEPMLLSGWIRKDDQIYSYVYKRHFYIMVWKINGLRRVNLSTVPIDQNVYLDNVELRGEILDAGTGLETEVRYGPFFEDTIVVDLDEYSKISQSFEGPNYRGFYGTVSKIAFENGHQQILAMENYDRWIMHTLFVMYKAHGTFYMIIINSKRPFGVKMLSLLNLHG